MSFKNKETKTFPDQKYKNKMKTEGIHHYQGCTKRNIKGSVCKWKNNPNWNQGQSVLKNTGGYIYTCYIRMIINYIKQ